MAGGQDGTFSFVPAMVLKPWKQTETLPDAEKIITSINLARRLYTQFLKIDQDCYVKPRGIFQLSWPGVRKYKSASSAAAVLSSIWRECKNKHLHNFKQDFLYYCAASTDLPQQELLSRQNVAFQWFCELCHPSARAVLGTLISQILKHLSAAGFIPQL